MGIVFCSVSSRVWLESCTILLALCILGLLELVNDQEGELEWFELSIDLCIWGI